MIDSIVPAHNQEFAIMDEELREEMRRQRSKQQDSICTACNDRGRSHVKSVLWKIATPQAPILSSPESQLPM
jgi:hypothetical protein